MSDWYKDLILSRIYKRRHIVENGCWEWTGPLHKSGYAQIDYNGSKWKVHRLVMFILHPELYFSGPCILHKCDNRKCFNPDHLSVGTYSDNALDRTLNGKDGHAKITHCPRGHEYNTENTYYNNRGHRSCRVCNKIIQQGIRAQKEKVL